MKRPLVILSIILGVILLIIAGIYIAQPAKFLPHFFPGYDMNDTKTHFKHGIGAFLLSLGAFALAWFQSGKKQQ